MPNAPTPDPQEEPRVRLTVDLPRSLHRELKRAAVDHDTTLSDLARIALRQWLEQR